MLPSSPLGWIALSVSALITGAFIFVGVMVLLVFIGGPSSEAACRDRTMNLAPAADRGFDTRWDFFDIFLDTGVPDNLDLEEDVVTARARDFLTMEHDFDELEDIVICFFGAEEAGELGQGEVRGKVAIPILPDVSASIMGRVDLTGTHPMLTITDIDVGSLPGFITSAMDDAIEDEINEALEDVDLRHRYTIQFREGFVQVNGRP
jgi:hypothetical protein